MDHALVVSLRIVFSTVLIVILEDDVEISSALGMNLVPEVIHILVSKLDVGDYLHRNSV